MAEAATAVARAVAVLHREARRVGVTEAACMAGAGLPGISLGWIGFVDGGTGTVRPVASFGSQGHGPSVRVVLDPADPQGRGPTAEAIRTGLPVTMEADDPRLAPWRVEIQRRQLRSVLALPLARADGTVFAALALWSDLPGFFDQVQIALCEVFATALSMAFESERLRERLAEADGGSTSERTAELEQRNTALQEASRLKSEFLANLSHELRSPLTGIIGFSEVLHDELYGPLNARQKEHVQLIWDAGKRLLALLEDILDLSRVEAGRSEPDLTENYPRQIAESVVVMVQQAAFTQGVRLDWSVAPGAEMTVLVDARKVKQALLHLLSAAVKRAGKDGMVALDVDVEGDTLLFHVRDSGPALAPEDPTLFRPFAKVETRDGTGRERTGVGLALARALVELHGGSIKARASDGRGNVFTVEIPLRRGSGAI